MSVVHVGNCMECGDSTMIDPNDSDPICMECKGHDCLWESIEDDDRLMCRYCDAIQIQDLAPSNRGWYVAPNGSEYELPSYGS